MVGKNRLHLGFTFQRRAYSQGPVFPIVFVWLMYKKHFMNEITNYSSAGLTKMIGLTKEDFEMLKKTPKVTLLSLLSMHIKNIWRVDGLYFLGIEEKFGTEAATQIDTDCWKVLGKLEARELKNLLKIEKTDIPAFMHALRNTSWSLYQEEKATEVSPFKGVFRVAKCRIQETRINRALGVFPCKNVRFSYLKSFAEEFNPDIEAKCQVAPPEKRPSGVWCQWEFTLKGKK